MECRNVLMMNIPCNKGSRKHKSTGERALMDSTLHRGSFEKHESHYNRQKRLLTGYGVTFGSLLNCPHSLACQPCHIPFVREP